MLLPIPRSPTPLGLRVLLAFILPISRVPVPAFVPIVVDAGPGVYPYRLVALGADGFCLAAGWGVVVPGRVGVGGCGGEQGEKGENG